MRLLASSACIQAADSIISLRSVALSFGVSARGGDTALQEEAMLCVRGVMLLMFGEILAAKNQACEISIVSTVGYNSLGATG